MILGERNRSNDCRSVQSSKSCAKDAIEGLSERFHQLNSKIQSVRSKYLKSASTSNLHGPLPSSQKTVSGGVNTQTAEIRGGNEYFPTEKLYNPRSEGTRPGCSDRKYYVHHFSSGARKDGGVRAKEHLSFNLKTVHFMKGISKSNMEELEYKMVWLPDLADPKRKTLLLDLDQTLMHCYRKQLASPVAVNDIILPSSKSKGMRIALRPFVKEFLSSVSKLFEVIVFTASSKSYADAVIDQLDPDKLYVSHRLYREHCHRTELGLLVKDLRVIGNRKLENLVLVDNAHHSYMFQQANGIPILPFRNDYEDNELQHLLEYLMTIIQTASDVRQANELHFQLSTYDTFREVESLISNLYRK